jgi:integrase
MLLSWRAYHVDVPHVRRDGLRAASQHPLHDARRASENPQRLALRPFPYLGAAICLTLGGVVVVEDVRVHIPEFSKAAGVEGAGVHTLRHSAAVAWLESGVHIKAVADLLGHSSISITGDIYGHTSDETARSAVDGWSGVLGL